MAGEGWGERRCLSPEADQILRATGPRGQGPGASEPPATSGPVITGANVARQRLLSLLARAGWGLVLFPPPPPLPDLLRPRGQFALRSLDPLLLFWALIFWFGFSRLVLGNYQPRGRMP